MVIPLPVLNEIISSIVVSKVVVVGKADCRSEVASDYSLPLELLRQLLFGLTPSLNSNALR